MSLIAEHIQLSSEEGVFMLICFVWQRKLCEQAPCCQVAGIFADSAFCETSWFEQDVELLVVHNM
jgi:hypothetical protein